MRRRSSRATSRGTSRKSVDHDRLDVAPGDTATFTYTLTVTHEIGPEIEWLVFGTIHVHNPNVFDVSGVDVTDAVDNGGTCAMQGRRGPSRDDSGQQHPRLQLPLLVHVGTQPVERNEHGDGHLAADVGSPRHQRLGATRRSTSPASFRPTRTAAST